MQQRATAPDRRKVGGLVARLCRVTMILALASMPASVFAQEMTWSEAVTWITAERTKATECVKQLKKRGDAASQEAGREKYEIAKSAMDAVIAGLIAALEDGSADVEAGKVDADVTGAVKGRLSFCATVEPLIPPSDGDKNIFADIMRDTLKPTIAAAARLLGIADSEENVLRRKTIQTQLEGARWPGFDFIPAAS